MLSQTLPLACLISVAAAMAFKGPRATSAAEMGDLLVSPATTTPPRVHPDLVRRDTVMTDLVAPDNTCGYISGLPGAAYTCNLDYLCAFFPGSSSTIGFVGCCNPDNFDCDSRATCVDYNQFYSSSVCDNGCEKDTFTLKCTNPAIPYCNGIRFPANDVQDYFCDSETVSTWQTALTTYNQEDDGRVFSPVTVTITSGAAPASGSSVQLTFSDSDSSNPSAAATSGGAAPSSSGAGSSPVVSAPGSSSSSASPVASSSSSKAPIGAIVGGVVGGIGGLALAGLAIFFLLRHNKKNNASGPNTNGFNGNGPNTNGFNVVNPNGTINPPNYNPAQDPNNPAFVAAAATGKPNPTVQETALNGQWTPAPTEGGYAMQPYPPQAGQDFAQNQQQYQQPMQQQQQQQYPQQGQAQGYSQPGGQQLPYNSQMQPSPFMGQQQQQQQPAAAYPTGMAEVPGSFVSSLTQHQQQQFNPTSQITTPTSQFSSPAFDASTPAQTHAVPERDAYATSPISSLRVSELGPSASNLSSVVAGAQAHEHSPALSYVSPIGGTPVAGAVGLVGQPPAQAQQQGNVGAQGGQVQELAQQTGGHQGHAQENVEGRAEMSANMAGGGPLNMTYEVPG